MAVLGVFPPLMIPAIGIPITAQSMGPMLVGGILGAKRGTLSMLLFLALVAVGLPLLSGGRGGLAAFAGPTAGFIYGWIAAASVIGCSTERFWTSLAFPPPSWRASPADRGPLRWSAFPGIAAVGMALSLDRAFLGSAAFIPGDLIKAGVAAAVIVMVKPAYPLISPDIATRSQPDRRSGAAS